MFVDVTEIRRLESLRRDFVANVSHELRTPVTSVLSASETLASEEELKPETRRRFVEIIERNAQRLQNLVEDLLDLSRIESRQYHMNKGPVILGPVFEHVIDMFRQRAKERGLSLRLSFGDSLPAVNADQRALEHVLINLVDNAVKYCDAGTTIELSAAGRGQSVRITVADDGPGIAAQHVPRLFERFYRVDRGRSRDQGGTGLGLAIVKHLVEAMGASIEVESQEGKGTPHVV